jgi:hypothetical protein
MLNNQYREAKAPEKRGYKKLHMMQVEKGANGGHSITHHYSANTMELHAPKVHHFGPEDGKDGTTHAHITEHLKAMGIHPAVAEMEEEKTESPREMAAEERSGEEVEA